MQQNSIVIAHYNKIIEKSFFHNGGKYTFPVSTLQLRGSEPERCGNIPGDLKTRKGTGTSCLIEIHFSNQTAKFS